MMRCSSRRLQTTPICRSCNCSPRESFPEATRRPRARCRPHHLHRRSSSRTMEALALARRVRQIVLHGAFSTRIGLEAVSHNTLRAGLTSLGILFGVASVIAMLAIGAGAEQEILEQMRLLGSNNVVVTPLVEQKEEKVKPDDGRKQQKRFTPGLNRRDVLGIAQVVPHVAATSGEVVVQTLITREGHRRSGEVDGVDTSEFRLVTRPLARGSMYTNEHH